MNVEIYQVSLGQFDQMLGVCENKEIIIHTAKLSAEIIVGMYDNKPLCYIGLAPRTLISDEAYVWMLMVDAKHPFLIARYARGVMETIMAKYSVVFGHCFSEASARWLTGLGAHFLSPTEFEFRRR